MIFDKEIHFRIEAAAWNHRHCAFCYFKLQVFSIVQFVALFVSFFLLGLFHVIYHDHKKFTSKIKNSLNKMEIFLWGDNCYCHFTTSLVSTTELLSQWGDKPSHKVHCPSQNGNYLASLKHSLQYHNPISPLQLVKHSILLCDARSTIKSD